MIAIVFCIMDTNEAACTVTVNFYKYFACKKQIFMDTQTHDYNNN